MPTVARLPLGPMVTLAPFGPKERDPPDLLRLRVTPGAILIRLQKRKGICYTSKWMRKSFGLLSNFHQENQLFNANTGFILDCNLKLVSYSKVAILLSINLFSQNSFLQQHFVITIKRNICFA